MSLAIELMTKRLCPPAALSAPTSTTIKHQDAEQIANSVGLSP